MMTWRDVHGLASRLGVPDTAQVADEFGIMLAGAAYDEGPDVLTLLAKRWGGAMTWAGLRDAARLLQVPSTAEVSWQGGFPVDGVDYVPALTGWLLLKGGPR
jgi:hypothetical protein